MAFQPAVQTAVTVTCYTGRLLPYLLTLTPLKGRLFSSLPPYPHGYLSFDSAVPFAARTFLCGPERHRSDRANCCQLYKYIAKIANFIDSNRSMPASNHISVDDFRYPLGESFIASHPLPDRDQSRLLFYNRGSIDHRIFRELPGLVPPGSRMVFNNTRVIQARLHFRKSTGAKIEIFCLEPVAPPDYQQSFGSSKGCTWRCLVGHARRWKTGPLFLNTMVSGKPVELKATLEEQLGESAVVRFEWEEEGCSFSEIIENAGTTPIPPYLKREAEESDRDRYQTVYNRDPGSVAAPTAGLHFTKAMLDELARRGITRMELTLHVGAGTFVPIKQKDARQHDMHTETVLVSRSFLEHWAARPSGLIAVGTTSARSLETLYWLGVKRLTGAGLEPARAAFRQWENEALPGEIPLKESLGSLIDYCTRNRMDHFQFSTGLMIVPGYRFRTIDGLLTNFHLPGSTLLLLIAAFIGEDWRKVYDAAMENRYRFLSYGDSSLLLPGEG
jgi:S-adenosylmethionine:tRNA ribosyltransferase-isomerase